MLAANACNMVGFTFVMEAPSGEYLEPHPSPFWTYLKTHYAPMPPHGLELSQTTFYICFPAAAARVGLGCVVGPATARGGRTRSSRWAGSGN